MLLDKNWKVESDELNVTLYERFVSKKSGTEYWKPHSYFPTVGDALRALVNIRVNRSGLKDLETVQLEIEKLYQLIEPAFITQPITKNVTGRKRASESLAKGDSTSPK